MTISMTSNRIQYTADGIETDFQYQFYVPDDSDLKVYEDSTLKTLTTHYTMTNAGDESGGTVTFLVAPSDGDVITLQRQVSNTQPLDLTAYDKFPAETVEAGMDRLLLLIQQNSTNITSYLEGTLPGIHTHTESDVTDLDRYTQAQVDALIAGVDDTVAIAAVASDLATHEADVANPHSVTFASLPDAPASLPPDSHTHAQSEITSKEAFDEADTSGWRDLKAHLIAAAVGAGTPALTAFGPSGNIKQIAFAIGDSVYFSFHVDHDIKVGTDMFLHVHWSSDGIDTNTVKWECDYTYAERNDSTPDTFPADSTISLEQAGAGAAWSHMVNEDVTGITAPEVDTIILMELKRVTNGGTDNTDTIFGITVDFHYETDHYSTKNRAPDFYS